MNLSNINIQRIKRDKEMLKNANLESQGIYIDMDDNIDSPIKVMIIGPKDTPYECGFYMFEFYLGKHYPWHPPKGKFLTTDGKSRMHPNLYAKCGKICLSLLGTWSGPSWTACQTILSVIISLIPLFNEFPLQCEPSYEISVYNPPNTRHKDYNKFVCHENLRIAVLGNYDKPPDGYECFTPIICEKINEYIGNYIKICDENMHIKSITSCIYGCVKTTEYMAMKQRFKKIEVKHDDEEIDSLPAQAIETVDNVKTEDIVIKKSKSTAENVKTENVSVKKSKSKVSTINVPTTKAKHYDDGFVLLSANDNRTYKVKSIYSKTTNKFLYKRWVLI